MSGTVAPDEHLGTVDRTALAAYVLGLGDDALILGQREFSALLDLVPTMAHKLLIGLARRIHDVDAQKVN